MSRAAGAGRRLSSLRPLAWRWRLPAAAAGLIAGQVAAEIGGPWPWRIALAAALAAPAFALRHRAVGTAALLAGGAAVLGLVQVAGCSALRWQESAPAPPRALDLTAAVEAAQARPGFAGQRGVALDLRLIEVAPEGTLVRPGERVRLSVWDARAEWQAGERVRFRAALRRPRGLCNSGVDRRAAALSRLGIDWTASLPRDGALQRLAPGVLGPRDWLARARARTGRAIDAVLAPAEAAVLRAIVVGDQAGLPDDLRIAYARTGTTHVLSVSGLHIAIVAGSVFAVVRALLARWPMLALRVVPARAAALAALLPAAAYAVFTGAAVATVRSLVMSAVYLLGVAFARPPDLLVAIAAAAAAICLADPAASFDISFQLSFGAVLAIIGGMRVIERALPSAWLHPPPAAGWLWRARAALVGALCVSIAAGVGTAPLTAAHFGMIALAGVLANLLVVPLLGWGALFCGLFGACLLVFSDRLAGLCFALGGTVIHASGAVVLAISALPLAAVSVRTPAPLEAAAWMAALAGLTLARPRHRRLVCALGCSAAIALAWLRIHAAEARMRVSFLDVGQGDAVLLELPGDRALAVDGGGSGGGDVAVSALRARGLARLDAIALSHPQLDHYGGFPALLEAFPVAAFWSTGASSPTASFARLSQSLDRARVARRALSAGDSPGDFGDVEITVLHPTGVPGGLSVNDRSLVLAARYGAVRVLFTGDIEAPAESALRSGGGDLEATILKVPHHGSRTSSGAPLVLAIRPGLAVAGTGDHNRFGFPAAEVRARYLEAGALWRETGRSGELVADSDGQIVRVRECRPQAEAGGPERSPDGF